MTINGQPYSQPRNVNLKNGILMFGDTNTTSPLGTTYNGLYVNDSNELIYVHQGTSVTIGTGGGGSTPTWDDLYDADKTMQIDSTTWTLAGVHATNDVLTVTNSGTGAALQITSSGTGKDINGTSDTWHISKAGLATFVSIVPGGDITSTAIAIDWDLIDDNASALSFDAAGKTGLIAIVTTNAGEGVTMSATLTVAGAFACGVGSNTVSGIVVTDNTVTTFGANADSAGVAVLRSTSLTTGSLLQLQLTEGTLSGGFYLTCRSVGVANVLTIGENGRITIVGAGGSNMLAITAGDAVLSDGSLTMTDADNAASLSITNNTATTASVFVFAGSGVFTGSTTTSFVTITPSGLTTGTAVYLPVAGLTTGKAIHVVANALTTGNLLSITSSATAIATTGRLLSVVHSGATGTSAVLSEFSSAATDETTILKVTASAVLAAGKAFHVSCAAMTTGTGIYINATEATITTGKYLECYNGAANDFSIAKYGATIIAGTAQGTVALTVTKGDFSVTDGNATLGGKFILSGTETIAGGGTSTALALTETMHYVDADAGGDIFTLANGVEGQLMFIVCASATGICTVTPATMKGGTSVTMNAAGDTVLLAYIGTGWSVLGGNGHTIIG